jgi:hypothetical protein
MTQGAGSEAQRFESALARALRSTHVYVCVYIYSFNVEDAVGPSTALALLFSTNELVTMAGRGESEDDWSAMIDRF